jgi:hypothetical protein
MRTFASARRSRRADSPSRRNPGRLACQPVHPMQQPMARVAMQAVQQLRRTGAHSVQPKLRISTPGDAYEREADRVADAVMRMRRPDLRPEPKPAPLAVDRMALPPGLGAVSRAGGGGGRRLPASVRSFFEPRFGHDFANVRVHADSNAAETTSGLHARAFTVGSDIYFGPGQYAPGTAAGDKLLAHELAHTIQQGRAAPGLAQGPWGGTAPIALSGAPPSIQRKESVVASTVTQDNPLERILRGETPGLTTPVVNGTTITDTTVLDTVLPSPVDYSIDQKAGTCTVGAPIDITSSAEVITATPPGKNGWTASMPFAALSKVLPIKNKDCSAKKGDVKVRMIAEIGNEAFAKLVRKSEGEHEAVIKEIHGKYLKPYHDFVNSKVGSNKDPKKCAEGLAKQFRDKEVDAINKYAKAYIDSTNKLDGPGGPHRSDASPSVVGKCDEILVTIRR